MKNFIKNSLVLVVLFTTLLGNANETFVLRNLNDNKTTMLTLLDVKKGNQLLIKDASGFILYNERIQNSGVFSKGFNFTSLPNGAYYFELKKDSETNKIPFNVVYKRVELNEVKTSTVKKALKKSKKSNKRKRVARKDDVLHRTVLDFKEAYYNEYNNLEKK